jgi:hypothetical protein
VLLWQYGMNGLKKEDMPRDINSGSPCNRIRVMNA